MRHAKYITFRLAEIYHAPLGAYHTALAVYHPNKLRPSGFFAFFLGQNTGRLCGGQFHQNCVRSYFTNIVPRNKQCVTGCQSLKKLLTAGHDYTEYLTAASEREVNYLSYTSLFRTSGCFIIDRLPNPPGPDSMGNITSNTNGYIP